MKVGETWKYKKGIEPLIQLDPYCYEQGDEFITIDFIEHYNNGTSIGFVHNKGRSCGACDRKSFLKIFEKVYDENR